MSKIIELTAQLHVHRVSCPGVWLCQDGFVRLSVFALGTSYQTCLLPPLFPILFKDVFYFKKSFQENCAINNICCLLKNETIYCELVQLTEDCVSSKYVVLAQYLANLNDVLFPPNACTTEGIDLLMRRTKQFPGILSPKIEITTKVRIDELWCSKILPPTYHNCNCLTDSYYDEPARKTKVCHTPRYHRQRCDTNMNDWKPLPRSKSRSKSQARLYSNYDRKMSPGELPRCNSRLAAPRSSSCTRTFQRVPACVYNVQTLSQNPFLGNNKRKKMASQDTLRSMSNYHISESSLDRWIVDDLNTNAESVRTIILDSNNVRSNNYSDKFSERHKRCKYHNYRPRCDCEICKRYHQLFHKGMLCSDQGKRNFAK